MKTRQLLIILILVFFPLLIILGAIRIRNRNEYRQTGKIGGKWGEGIPLTVDAAAMQRGRDLYIAHGAKGHGQNGNGSPGKSSTDLMEPEVRAMKDGEIFGVISSGTGNMPGLEKTLSASDRWRLVAYLRALQRRQDPKNGVVITIQEAMTREIETLKHPWQNPGNEKPKCCR